MQLSIMSDKNYTVVHHKFILNGKFLCAYYKFIWQLFYCNKKDASI